MNREIIDPKRIPFRHSVTIEAYGVSIRVGVNRMEALKAIHSKLPQILPRFRILGHDADAQHHYGYVWNDKLGDKLFRTGDHGPIKTDRDALLDVLSSEIRLKVAEFAVNRTFVHAGVVGIGGKAIIIPGKSFDGKTTLTAELVRRGALYYSDEYAVIHPEGRVSPFLKPLSMRGIIDPMQQVDVTLEEIGGSAGKRPIPVGMIVVTKYQAGAKWRPRRLGSSKGAMVLLQNSVSVRRDPHLTISAIAEIVRTAAIVSSKRGEAPEVADKILELFAMKCWHQKTT
jgi:hypothetical protein